MKSTNKWSNKSINDLLQILQLALPKGSNIPATFVEAQKIIAKLGLKYEKIHVCPNNCQLYWKDKKDDDFCSKCKASRWKNKPNETSLTKKERRKATPNKVLRYFPIKPRLKRLFMNKETAKLTTQSIPNCKTFDFFDTKFDHSSYSKICVKYHFFRRSLVY